MPQIRAENEHLIIHIHPTAEPTEDSIHGDCVAKVVYAGSATVLEMCLAASQTNTLANTGKVVPCATIAWPLSIFIDKKAGD